MDDVRESVAEVFSNDTEWAITLAITPLWYVIGLCLTAWITTWRLHGRLHRGDPEPETMAQQRAQTKAHGRPAVVLSMALAGLAGMLWPLVVAVLVVGMVADWSEQLLDRVDRVKR